MSVRRVSERSTFVELRRRGRRARVGGIAVSYLPESIDGSARVAYAVGGSVGSAVVRNRVRRRLRAVVRSLDLPAGTYLLRADAEAARLPYASLEEEVTEATKSVTEGNP